MRDANGRQLLYVHQKLLKLKEEINVFADDSQSRRLYGIKADRILDWSARYDSANSSGDNLGAAKRHGTRSLWKACYDILNSNQVEFHVQEENALVRIMDTLVDQVPILGMFSGYFLNPVYLVRRGSVDKGQGSLVMRMVKKPSITERRFLIEKVDSGLTAHEEERLLLGLFMVAL